MAKKNKKRKEYKSEINLPSKNPRGERIIEQDEMSDGLSALHDELMGSMTEEDRSRMELMFALAEMGVEPQEYDLFYRIHGAAGSFAKRLVGESEESDVQFDGFGDFGFPFAGMGRRYAPVKAYDVMPEASEHTLKLKIQMKDVAKPPMWREITIPADFNFEQLHEAIQDIMGLEDCHLWQFNKSAYQDSLIIGLPSDSDSRPGIEDATHEADETPLTMFLQHKGDKLEYVYDFGDDWIFTVEVKDVIGLATNYPVCTKYKGDLNPIEDMGGVWAYTHAREILGNWDNMSDKERVKAAEEYCFDTPEDYINYLRDHLIDLEETNEALARISR